MMVNEEEYLKQKMGTGHPFTVPEGYFDRLAEQVMKQIPEQMPEQMPVKKPTVRRLRPWLYAAACAGVVALSATLLFNSSKTVDKSQAYALAAQTETSQDAAQMEYSDNYIEDAAYYAMIDNEEIYAYLAEL